MIKVVQTGNVTEDIRRIIQSINASPVLHLANAVADDDAGGSSGGGAPTTATYLTLTPDPFLTNERVFTPSDGLVAVDGGANGPYTLSVSDLYHPFLLMGG